MRSERKARISGLAGMEHARNRTLPDLTFPLTEWDLGTRLLLSRFRSSKLKAPRFICIAEHPTDYHSDARCLWWSCLQPHTLVHLVALLLYLFCFLCICTCVFAQKWRWSKNRTLPCEVNRLKTQHRELRVLLFTISVMGFFMSHRGCGHWSVVRRNLRFIVLFREDLIMRVQVRPKSNSRSPAG